MRRFIWFDCPPHWPLSIFNPRGPHSLIEFAAIAGTVVLGALAIIQLPRRNYPPVGVATLALLIVLFSNAIQGVPKGFFNPIAGGRSPEQYYHDARNVHSARALLRHFTAIQPALHTHARTHPPGAVLLFYLLRRLTGDRPALVAIAIACAATLVSAWGFRRLARNVLDVSPAFAGFGTLLFLFLPAIQIYYCATLDALIAALLLAAVALWSSPPSIPRASILRTLSATVCIVAASFLTFGWVWVMPLLIVLDLRRVYEKKMCWRDFGLRGFCLLMALALLYFGLHHVFGFDYIRSGRIATHLENPRGYRLFAEPISFGFTRVEDVSEILVFFGPFLIALAGRGLSAWMRGNKRSDGFVAFAVATGTLVFLFLTGAYHTGETARACIFVYPYLLLPALHALRTTSLPEQKCILTLVLTQTIVMQTWGNYFW